MVEIAQVVGTGDKNLVQKWNGKFLQCQQGRMNFERQWHQNMAFYFDRQWIVISSRATSSGGFMLSEAPMEDKWRVRHTANRVKRVIRTELTKLSKEEPQFYSLPASTDESDRAAASAGDSIADWLMHNKYFNKKRMEATFWTVICGTAFLKNWYDPNKLELDGQPGKIDFDAITAFHLYVPNLQISDIQEQPYVIHAKGMTPEDVWNTYGKEVPPSSDTMSTLVDSRFLTSMGIRQTKNQESKMCHVKEVWIKPNKEFPKGAMFCIAEQDLLYIHEPQIDPTAQMGMGQLSGQQLALPVGSSPPLAPQTPSQVLQEPPQKEPLNSMVQFDVAGMQGRQYEFPYRHGRYPFAKIDHIPTGMFYAESVIKAFIPLQKEYNRTRSVMLENRNLAGKPQWGYIKGAFDPKHFTAKPGLLLAVNLGFEPPKALDQPVLPPSVSAELQVIQADMDDVSSQTEITKGRTPPGVEAASAIAYLQEENDTVLHHTVVSLESAVQETGTQVLANVHDYWSEERIVAMTSKNQSYEVKKFKGAGLNPFTDFRVESNSMAPRSTAAKQAFITELMKLGAIPFQQAAKYLQMSETNKMYDDLMLDDRHAQRENMKMADGDSLEKMDLTPPPVGADQQGLPGMPSQSILGGAGNMGGGIPGNSGMPPGMPPMAGVPQGIMPGMGMQQPQEPQPKMAPELDEYGKPTGQTYIITTNSFDNHEAHIRVHTDYMKTEEFELLPPDIQQIFEDHVNEHKKELLKERSSIDQYNTNAQPDQQLQNSSQDQGAKPSSSSQPVGASASPPSSNGATSNAG